MTSKQHTYKDPHVLYEAFHLQSKLRYAVPLQMVYEMVENEHEKARQGVENALTSKELFQLLRTLSDHMVADALKQAQTENSPYPESNELKDHVRKMLALLDVKLSSDTLNQIVKGELRLEDVMEKEGQDLWQSIFQKTDTGRYAPDIPSIQLLTSSTQALAMSSLERRIHEVFENERTMELEKLQETQELARSYKILEEVYDLEKNYHLQPQRELEESLRLLETEREKFKVRLKTETGVDIEKTYEVESTLDKENALRDMDRKQVELKLYVAHMQGYDRDLDGDGSGGINRATGEVIDYDDIYIADKAKHMQEEEREEDEILVRDIRRR
jgi:hypothetical protein